MLGFGRFSIEFDLPELKANPGDKSGDVTCQGSGSSAQREL